MDSILAISNLIKTYPKFQLGELSVNIPKGFLTALIGSNGAGKSTFIDIICGVRKKNQGTINYFGRTDDIDDVTVRNDIGYCSATKMLSSGWNAKDIAKSMSLAFDNFDRDKFNALCKKFGLENEFDKKPQPLVKLSDGNQMRMCLASVLARNTQLLILDEPGSSLDPVMRDELCDMFRQYIADGNGERSIMFSTHNIADMEFATDYAIFMHCGKIVEKGFVEDLKEKYILVHGDGSLCEKCKPYMVTTQGNTSQFEGIALAENKLKLQAYDVAIEVPNLQQISVSILRKAAADNE